MLTRLWIALTGLFFFVCMWVAATAPPQTNDADEFTRIAIYGTAASMVGLVITKWVLGSRRS